MKTGRLILTIMVLGALVSAPFSHLPVNDSDMHGGFVCYCCPAAGGKCTMISCSGCSGCGSHSGSDLERWSPEMILSSFHSISPSRIVYREEESCRSPESAYIDLLDKPPNRA